MSTTTDAATNSQANSGDAAAAAAAAAGAAAGAEAGKDGQQQDPKPSEQAKPVSQEAYRALQSRADKAQAELDRVRAESERAVAAALEAGRQATLAGLKPEERDAQIRQWRLEDRERALQSAERDQEETARALTVKTLSLDYKLDDKAQAELEKITDVNEMRARAAELRVETLQRELDEAKAGAGSQAAGEKKTPPAGMRGIPEGGGQGGGTGAYDPSKYRGTNKIAESLKAQRAAGMVRYEKIPIQGR